MTVQTWQSRGLRNNDGILTRSIFAPVLLQDDLLTRDAEKAKRARVRLIRVGGPRATKS